MVHDSNFQSPFASPNAIPPRTSSHGIVNGAKHRTSVLRPLSEIDWMSQSKKHKPSHNSISSLTAAHNTASSQAQSRAMNSQPHTHVYPTPMTPPPPDPLR